MNKNSKIYVAGHGGMVGSAIVHKLQEQGFSQIVTRTSKELDLRNQVAVGEFFKIERPEFVFLAAARVGGILANSTQPAMFIYDNLMIQSNVIHSSFEYGVKKLLFLGSSCIYPKFAQQPIKEEFLLTGGLEETNEPYAIAKIAGIKMCSAYRKQYACNFISAMPTNLYGLNDNFDLLSSHVLPAMIEKFVQARLNGLSSVEIWGTGQVFREFLHVDDLAEACLFLMDKYDESEIVNIGYGKEISIYDLAVLVARCVGFKGKIELDLTKPDGTPRKLLDSSKIERLGWSPKVNLELGIKEIIKKRYSITTL